MWRRHSTHCGARFRRAVFAGQCAILVVLLGSLGLATKLTSVSRPPERAAIDRWIGEQTPWHEINRWHPTQSIGRGETQLVEVEYTYRGPNDRPVRTRRTFRVTGEDVNEVVDE